MAIWGHMMSMGDIGCMTLLATVDKDVCLVGRVAVQPRPETGSELEWLSRILVPVNKNRIGCMKFRYIRES